MLKTSSKFRVRSDGARVVEAAGDRGIEGHKVMHEEPLKTRETLRPMGVAKGLHPNGPRVKNSSAGVSRWRDSNCACTRVVTRRAEQLWRRNRQQFL